MADSETALENWVRGSLGHAYDGVADEQLPDEWIRLLDGAPAQ